MTVEVTNSSLIARSARVRNSGALWRERREYYGRVRRRFPACYGVFSISTEAFLQKAVKWPPMFGGLAYQRFKTERMPSAQDPGSAQQVTRPPRCAPRD